MKPTYTNTQELPYTLSVEEMAAFLGISRVGAYNLSHSKGFPSKRIGKRILIPRDAFLAWLKDLPEVSEASRKKNGFTLSGMKNHKNDITFCAGFLPEEKDLFDLSGENQHWIAISQSVRKGDP